MRKTLHFGRLSGEEHGDSAKASSVRTLPQKEQPNNRFFCNHTGGSSMKGSSLIALFALCLMLVAQPASAQITGSKHDLSGGGYGTTELCVFCHTPHYSGSTTFLWNRTAPASGYNVYVSTSMDATAADPATAVSPSLNCLSCHDGTVAYNSLVNMPGAGYGTPGTSGLMTQVADTSAFIGRDLRNDHPIAITYQTARSAQTPSEFNAHTLSGSKLTVTDGTTTLPLYGTTVANATVECGSCHDPHKTTNAPFLRVSNSGSAVCKTCHVK